MKAFTLFAFAACVNIGWSQCEKQPFLLFELFTSQGCFSAPPADKDLANYWINVPFTDNALFVGHHVTSFNGSLPSPGCSAGNPSSWTDIYSSEKANKEHIAYGKKFAADPNFVLSYMPQIVIQGKWQTGPNGVQTYHKTKIEEKAKLYAAEEPEVGVCLTNPVYDTINNTVSFNYDVLDGKTNGSQHLVLLLMEDDTEPIEITSGENCGKTLGYTRVRRVQDIINLDATEKLNGEVTIDYTSDVNDRKIRVGAFVQDTASLDCLGGTKGFAYADQFASIDKIDKTDATVSLFPNPTNGMINISSASHNIQKIRIYDLAGTAIFDLNQLNTASYTLNTNAYNMAGGIYTYEILLAGSKRPAVGKLIVQ